MWSDCMLLLDKQQLQLPIQCDHVLKLNAESPEPGQRGAAVDVRHGSDQTQVRLRPQQRRRRRRRCCQQPRRIIGRQQLDRPRVATCTATANTVTAAQVAPTTPACLGCILPWSGSVQHATLLAGAVSTIYLLDTIV
jgi:hypothetical protein